jgi:hypothetical protein
MERKVLIVNCEPNNKKYGIFFSGQGGEGIFSLVSSLWLFPECPFTAFL